MDEWIHLPDDMDKDGTSFRNSCPKPEPCACTLTFHGGGLHCGICDRRIRRADNKHYRNTKVRVRRMGDA